jgi:ubiquinone biosynthesis protein
MDIDPDPVATASIAQVHKARLPDGTPVAVKIRLPGVRRLFDQDARIFRLLARMTAPLVRELDLEQVTEQLLELTREELDFSNEADNLERFARLDHPERIRVPGLYRELSTDAVLVTGWVEGERLRDYLDGHPDEAADLLGVLFTSYLQQVTRFGLYQADPHPGNFIVGPDGSITILDFGAIGRLTPDEVKRYSRLLYGLMGFEGDVDIGELFVQAGFRGGDADTLRELAMYVLSDRMNRAALGESMTDLIEKFRENRVEIPDSYIGIARVLITVGGFLMNYDVPFDWRPPEQRESSPG